jgi:hypothetical protein
MGTEVHARLDRDARGAVLIVALFASTLLIGLLFHLLGVGHAIEHGERYRDAADSSAYSAAVIEARGMNLVALLNMVKLSVVAVAASLLAIVVGATAASAWILKRKSRILLYGANLPVLLAISVKAMTTYLDRAAAYEATIEAADRAQEALRTQLPAIAALRASELAASYPPVERAVVTATELPIRKGDELDVCLRAFPYEDAIIRRAFRRVAGKPRRRAIRAADAAVTAPCLAYGAVEQRLRGDARMGGEPFQVRAYVLGAPIRDNEETGVKVATWRRDEAGGRVAELRDDLTGVGTAQAELYFGGHASHPELLWEMEWTARLRRFRVDDGFAAFAARCALRGGEAPCAELAEGLRAGQELFVH